MTLKSTIFKLLSHSSTQVHIHKQNCQVMEWCMKDVNVKVNGISRGKTVHQYTLEGIEWCTVPIPHILDISKQHIVSFSSWHKHIQSQTSERTRLCGALFLEFQELLKPFSMFWWNIHSTVNKENKQYDLA